VAHLRKIGVLRELDAELEVDSGMRSGDLVILNPSVGHHHAVAANADWLRPGRLEESVVGTRCTSAPDPDRHIRNSHKVYYGIFLYIIRSDIYTEFLPPRLRSSAVSGSPLDRPASS
jgi:hypothetical protein